MSDQFPEPEPTNLPDDVVTLLPRDGLDGFTFFAFEVDNQLGVAMTIHTQTLGDFIVPMTRTQITAMNAMFDRIAKLTNDDLQGILAQLRRQAEQP